MKKLITIFIVLLKSIDVLGIDNDTIRYQSKLWGLGFGQQKISFLSHVSFRNLVFASTSSKYLQTAGMVKTRTHYSNLSIGSSNISDEKDLSSMMFSFNYTYILHKRYKVFRKQLPENFPTLSVGWAYCFDTGIDLKIENTNNSTYYHLNNWAGLSLGIEKKVMINTMQVDLFNEFSIPVVGVYSGSEYSSSLPYFVHEKNANILQAFDIGSFETNFQLQNDFNIDFKIKPKRKRKARTLRFQYSIDYMNLRLNNNTKHCVFHTFKIGYLLNYSNYVHK